MTEMKVVGIETKMKEESFFDRLEKEADDLVEKIEKLADFLDSDKTAALSCIEVQLLVHQLKAMAEYLTILESRIALYEEAK